MKLCELLTVILIYIFLAARVIKVSTGLTGKNMLDYMHSQKYWEGGSFHNSFLFLTFSFYDVMNNLTFDL